MEVSNYIYDKYNERGMKAFEKRVKKILSNKVNIKQHKIKNVICHNAYMKIGNGSGSYYRVIKIEIDGEIFTMREHTNDSESWDNWHEPTKKMKRQLFEAVLESTVEQLIEELIELNES